MSTLEKVHSLKIPCFNNLVLPIILGKQTLENGFAGLKDILKYNI